MRPPSPDLFDPPPLRPDLTLEQRHSGVVAGVDEAGRGPWAGPVAVAAVILDRARVPDGLNDSKQLTATERERLYQAILADHAVALVLASARRIDQTNIRAATLWAMSRAVRALERPVDLALIDGRDVPPGLPCRGEAVIRGDARSLSIAAASIVAKVARDRLMTRLAETYPAYGFDRHMGYGTAAHAAALARDGVTPVHRRSFRPIAAALAQRD